MIIRMNMSYPNIKLHVFAAVLFYIIVCLLNLLLQIKKTQNADQCMINYLHEAWVNIEKNPILFTIRSILVVCSILPFKSGTPFPISH